MGECYFLLKSCSPDQIAPKRTDLTAVQQRQKVMLTQSIYPPFFFVNIPHRPLDLAKHTHDDHRDRPDSVLSSRHFVFLLFSYEKCSLSPHTTLGFGRKFSGPCQNSTYNMWGTDNAASSCECENSPYTSLQKLIM